MKSVIFYLISKKWHFFYAYFAQKNGFLLLKKLFNNILLCSNHKNFKKIYKICEPNTNDYALIYRCIDKGGVKFGR